MTKFVRVRLENGAHASVAAGFAESHKLPVLKQDAVGRDGKALPHKPKTNAGKATTTNPSGSDTTAPTQEDSK